MSLSHSPHAEYRQALLDYGVQFLCGRISGIVQQQIGLHPAIGVDDPVNGLRGYLRLLVHRGRGNDAL